jgi:hypothetical protein
MGARARTAVLTHAALRSFYHPGTPSLVSWRSAHADSGPNAEPGVSEGHGHGARMRARARAIAGLLTRPAPPRPAQHTPVCACTHRAVAHERALARPAVRRACAAVRVCQVPAGARWRWVEAVVLLSGEACEPDGLQRRPYAARLAACEWTASRSAGRCVYSDSADRGQAMLARKRAVELARVTASGPAWARGARGRARDGRGGSRAAPRAAARCAGPAASAPAVLTAAAGSGTPRGPGSLAAVSPSLRGIVQRARVTERHAPRSRLLVRPRSCARCSARTGGRSCRRNARSAKSRGRVLLCGPHGEPRLAGRGRCS